MTIIAARKSNNLFFLLFHRKYPEISSVDHLWVARVWIKDLGLNQYSSTFEAQMIDGRLLNVLTKKDMEKYLNVNKKFHQVRKQESQISVLSRREFKGFILFCYRNEKQSLSMCMCRNLNKHFQAIPSLCFKVRLSEKPLIWKRFFILMSIKLVLTRKVLHLAMFGKCKVAEIGNGPFYLFLAFVFGYGNVW